MAWLGDTEKCDYIKENSFNRNSKFRCVFGAATLEKRKPRKKKPSSKDDDSEELKRKYGRPISKEGCTAEGGSWVEFLSYLEVLKDVTSYSACAAAQKKDKRNKISWNKLRVRILNMFNEVRRSDLNKRQIPFKSSLARSNKT